MRQQLSLVLTASFLFLSQGVQGSPINHDDDNPSVAQSVGTVQVSTAVSVATSSTSEDLQCYRVTLGKKQPLFDKAGKWLDQRIPVPDHSVPSAQPMTSSQVSDALDVVELAPDQPDTRTLIQKTRQPGNITGLNFLEQTVFLEWMSANPVTRHKLLQTCRYYRAFVMPIMGETHFIEPSLRKDLLISIIAGQTGDVELFFRDRQLQALRILSIPDLREAIASGYYSGALSPKTEHGQTYRTIGPNSVEDFLGDKRLNLPRKGLRLVPLNFPGLEGITRYDLYSNQLKALDLSQQTALTDLTLYNNQLKTLDLSQQTALKFLSVSNNQLKTLDLSQQTALEKLNLSNNQLKELDLSKQMVLTDLYVDGNQLEALDLSKNTTLANLFLLNNQLKALDLSQNTALSCLTLYTNQLTTVSGLGGLLNLRILYLDAELCRDQNLLATLKGLNAKRRDGNSKIKLFASSKDANGKTSMKPTNLN